MPDLSTTDLTYAPKTSGEQGLDGDGRQAARRQSIEDRGQRLDGSGVTEMHRDDAAPLHAGQRARDDG